MRACFVVIRDGRAQAHFDPYGGVKWKDSFHDPESAVGHAGQADENREPLVHDPEGSGCLIDFDERTAIVFGGMEDPMNIYCDAGDDDILDEAEVRAYWKRFFEDVAPGWPDWLLRYDDRGVDAFAEHLQRRGITSVACRRRAHIENPWIVEFGA